MFDPTSKIVNFGTSLLNPQLRELTDSVKGNVDPGGVPIAEALLNPANKSPYRNANNIQYILNQMILTNTTITITPATMASGAAQTAIDALGRYIAVGVTLTINLSGGTYIPTADFTIENFCGPGEIVINEGSIKAGFQASPLTTIIQPGAGIVPLLVRDNTCKKIRINGIQFSSNTTYNLQLDNIKSYVEIDSCIFKDNGHAVGDPHIDLLDCQDVSINECRIDSKDIIADVDRSILIVYDIDNDGTDPGVSFYDIGGGGQVYDKWSHGTMTENLTTVISGSGFLNRQMIMVNISSVVDGSFYIGAVVEGQTSGAVAYVAGVQRDTLLLIKSNGLNFQAAENVDNATPYVGAKGVVSATPAPTTTGYWNQHTTL